MSNITKAALQAHPTPRGAITLWWLGQAGFLCKSPSGKIIVLDPYLSNSCKVIGDENGFDMDRTVPPPCGPADLSVVNAYLLTHSHQDHLDPETVEGYRAAGGRGPWFAPAETCGRLQSLGVPPAQITLVWPNQEVEVGDLRIRATFAIPFAGDDLTHIGYLVSVAGGPKVYFTGDTAYHEILSIAVGPHQPDVLVAVINGAFRNLGPAEAAMLAKQLGVKLVIPCHHDMFRDNSLPPQLLRTNLKLHGLGSCYRLLRHGEPFDYAVAAAGG